MSSEIPKLAAMSLSTVHLKCDVGCDKLGIYIYTGFLLMETLFFYIHPQ